MARMVSLSWLVVVVCLLLIHDCSAARCYVDASARDLNVGYVSSNDMRPDVCFSFCSQLKATYFGLQAGGQCFCGNSYNRYGTTTTCTQACSGDATVSCGNSWANNVYQITSFPTYQSLGCFADSTTRDLNGYAVVTTSLTVDLCGKYCGQAGFAYFGAQYSSQCFCGNRYNTYGSSSGCTMGCAGNSSIICGGSNANSVYKITNPIKPLVYPYIRYYGCYSATMAYTQGSTDQVGTCVISCKTLGYLYAGVKGSTCTCDNTTTGLTPSTACTSTCSIATLNCGGSSAIGVYDTMVFGISGYLGCYLDNSATRDLNGYSYSNSSLIIDDCINTCKTMGYLYAGVQNGNTCYCGLSYGKYGNSTACNMSCGGNQFQNCGGTTSNLVFSTFATNFYQNMVHFWPVDSGETSVHDYINSSDLVSSSPQFTTDRFGNANSAMLINSLASSWSAPTGYYFGSQYTFTGWFRPHSFVLWGRIFDFGNGAPIDNVYITYSCDYLTGLPSMGIHFGTDGVSRPSYPGGFLTSALSTETWYHIAFVINNANLSLYIDGALSSTFITPSVLSNSIQRMNNYFGKSAWTGDTFGDLDLDDLKFFNIALTQQQIQADKTWNQEARALLCPSCMNLPDSTSPSIVTVGSSSLLKLYDLTNGTLLGTVYGAGSGSVFSLIYVSSNVLAGSSNDAKVYFWNTKFVPVYTLTTGHTNAISCIVMATTNILITSSADNTAKAWNVSNNYQLLGTYTAHISGIFDMVLLDNGNLATYAGKYLNIWSWKATGTTILSIYHTLVLDIFSALQVSNDLIASGDSGYNVCLWSLTNGSLVRNLGSMQGIVSAMTLYRAEILLAHDSTGHLYFWNWVNGTNLKQFTSSLGSTYISLQMVSSGSLLISSSTNGIGYYQIGSSDLAVTTVMTSSTNAYSILPMTTSPTAPWVYIFGKNSLPASPLNMNRSTSLQFTASSLFVSQYDSTISYQWTIFLLDSTTYSQISQVTFTTVNPTLSQLALTIPGNTFDYGLYKAVFTTTITISSLSSQLNASDVTYFKVVPTGITVNALANSVTSLTVGSLQGLTLNPVLYSVDTDGLVSMSSLTFKFYCHLVTSSQVGVNFLLSGSSNQDLKTNLSTNDCFLSTSAYSFNSSGNILNILPGGFEVVTGKTSQFVISTTSSGYTYYQMINVIVNAQVPELPVPVISCHVPSFCIDYGNVKLFSTSNIIMVDGSYSGASDYINSVTYNWTVYKNLGNSTNYQWAQLSASQLTNLQGTTSLEMTISSNLFVASVDQWLVQFTIFTTSTISALNSNFSAKMILQANQKPYNGTCSIDLSSGYALDTKFTITCLNWADYDGIVTKYEFFASFLNNQSVVNLGNNDTGNFVTTFPAGLDTDSNRLYIFVQIFDNSGAITRYYISTPVIVQMQVATLVSSQSDILSGSSSNPIVASMQSSDLSVASSAIISYASSFNQAASTSSNSSNSSSSLSSSQIAQAVAVNEMFVNSMTNYDLTDLSSIKAASSVLSVVSSNPDLLSPSTAQKVGDLCATMTDNLKASASQYSLTFIYQAASYILDASANSVQSLNQQSSSSAELQSAASQQIDLVNIITSITASQLPVNGLQTVSKNNINLAIQRTTMNAVSNNTESNGCTFTIPNPCSVVGKSQGNCSDTAVVSQIYSRPSSLVLNTEVQTKGSSAISVSFFDSDMKDYNVKANSDGFYFWVSTGTAVSYTEINSGNTTISQTNQLQTFVMTLTTPNQSVTIQLMPTGNETMSVGYVICLKYGQVPAISSSSQVFDRAQVYCPSDLKTESGHKFYRMFSNISANVNQVTKVGYGYRQLTTVEYTSYCLGSTAKTLSAVPVVDASYDIKSLVSNQVSILAYASGCYYIDESSMAYSSWGVEVLDDSNSTHVHCFANHLTEFAGGLIVLPPSIDFDNVWANADFTKNMTIYLTVIIISALYVLLFIVCRYMDWQDSKRRCVYLLDDNFPMDAYFYELLVFTGTRRDAGTLSRVSFIMGGEDGETATRKLKPKDAKTKTLQRGSVDSFVMSTSEPLGDLQFFRVWHDNSGRGRNASWFLKFIIVHDLQSRKKYYFICNNWLAVEKSDGQIERILPVATDKQKTDLSYLMEKQTKEKMSDGHLWFSILARPAESAFNRTERLTCAFVLLCMTMLMNIMYYGVATSSSSSSNQLDIGPFSLSQTQVIIGVITNLIIFPPSFLLLQIFRKSRRRTTRTMKLKEHINQAIKDRNDEKILDEVEQQPIKRRSKKTKRQFSLPWWFKIIGYLISACIVGVCIFFIIVKGISFGDDLCRKWLTSFLISVITSICLTQPIQVILLSIFFVLLFRKSNEDKDLEYDHLDDGKSLNKLKFQRKSKNQEEDDEMAKMFRKELENTNSVVLMEMKRKKEMENKAWSMLKKIFVYSIYLFVLFETCYSKTSPLSYLYKTKLENTLTGNLSLVQTTDHMFSWIEDQFLPAVIRTTWYNGDSTSSDMSKYISDYSSFLVGSILIRQSRVISSSCSRKVGKNVCYPDYGVSNYDKTDYDPGWATYSSTSSQVKAFTYSTARSLNSQPYAGVYGNYLGGGYAFQIDPSKNSLSQAQQNFTDLQENEWVNENTRAVFIEFTLYNVNVDLFTYCTILFEILPTGSMVASYQLDPIALFSDESVFIVAIDIVYMFIVVFFVLKEIQLMIKLKFKGYITNWWSYLNWLVIIFSFVAFSMYLYRLYEKNSLMSILKANNGEIANFQTITYWNNLMLMFMAFCCFLASVKMLKLFMFSRNVRALVRVFQECFKEMVGFVVIYIVSLVAFTQLMYLMVYDRNAQFQSFARSMVTGFLMIIGKFNVDSYCQDVGNPLGQIIYSVFCVSMIMILLNMFITLLTNKFSEVRKQNKEMEGDDESIMTVFFMTNVWGPMKSIFKRNKGKKYSPSEEASQFKDSAELFENKTTQLIYQVNSGYQNSLKLSQ